MRNAIDYQKIDQMQIQLQKEREEAERRRQEMMLKEIDIRAQAERENKSQKDNLMHFIRQTGDKINNIVDRGQKELEERRQNR